MAAYTLVEAQTMLATYIEAEKSILKGQSYSIGDRALSRADLHDLAEQRKYWSDMVENLTAERTGPKVRSVIPRDS